MKLFTHTDISLEDDSSLKATTKDDIPEVSEDDISYIAQESMSIALLSTTIDDRLEDLRIVEHIKTKLDSCVSKESYFIQLESYTEVFKQLSKRLGVRPHIVSIEDFKSPMGFSASHSVVMEGIKDFLSKIWEAIKRFFRAFFDKVMTFFNRLLKLNLKLEQYEKYVRIMLDKLRGTNPKLTNTTTFASNLGKMMCEPNATEVTTDTLLTDTINRLVAFTRIYNKVLTNQSAKLLNDGSRKVIDAVDTFSSLDLIDTLKDAIDKIYDSKTPESLESAINDVLKTIPETTNRIVGDNQSSICGQVINALQNYYEVVLASSINPSEIPDKIQSELPAETTSISDSSCRALYSPSNKVDMLPNSYNVYITYGYDSSEPRVLVVSCTAYKEIESNVTTTMEPVENFVKLETVYKAYLDFKKNVNLEDVNRKLKDLQDDTSRIINIVDRKFVKGAGILSNVAPLIGDAVKSTVSQNTRDDSQQAELNSYLRNSTINQIYSANKDIVALKLAVSILDKNLLTYTRESKNVATKLFADMASLAVQSKYETIRYLYESLRRFSPSRS